MSLDFVIAAVRTTETHNARYWWVWVIVMIALLAVGVKFYVDKIKKK
ncbi:hypothetical protein [Modestobacter roseus]|nr:hypothetical protein [Modestobacter roseus]